MGAVLLTRVVYWTCPAGCSKRGVERVADGLPRLHFHPCPKVHGLPVPMVEEGADVKVEPVAREDYLGSEVQRRGTDGRPWAGVRTSRPDGSSDVAAFAGLAQGSAAER